MIESIEYILGLEEIDRDIYRGPVVKSELARTFGGQVAAQALVAATRTVDEEFGVHSLHGYFLKGGKSDRPTVFLVDRMRDGRSFCSRTVKAVQDGETIFSMQASFHRRGDEGIEHADKMRDIPGPGEFEGAESSLPKGSRALLGEWAAWDIRIVPESAYEKNPHTATEQAVWFRSRVTLPDDPTFHICTLAYMSDMTLLPSALAPHPGKKVQMASLDHAMWFLRPFRADDWLLYDQRSPSAANGRALTHGRIFNRQGDLVALVNQEGLTRNLREGATPIPLKSSTTEEG